MKIENYSGNSIFLNSKDSPVIINNCKIDTILPNQDGIQCLGRGLYIIKNTVVSNEKKLPTEIDELASVVNGATAIFYHCRFSGNGKGVLVGSR